MSFSKSSIFIQLIHPSTLQARCRSRAGELLVSSVDLDVVLGNDNGRFRVGGRGALEQAVDVHLAGAVLYARLLSRDGHYVACTIDLDELLSNNNGCLEWENKPQAPRAVTITADGQRVEHLGRTIEIRWSTKKATSLKRYSFTKLSHPAIFCTKIFLADGSAKELFFDLDQILGNRNGRLVWFSDAFANNFSTTAKNMKLSGTLLTLELRTLAQDYKQHSIDLNDVLAIEEGRLVLNRSGPGCDICHDLFRCGRWYSPDGSYSVNISGLERGSKPSCAICDLLRRGMNTYFPDEEHNGIDEVSAIIETISQEGFPLRIKAQFVRSNTKQKCQKKVECALYGTTGSDNRSITFQDLPSKRLLDTKLSRIDRNRLIKDLIETCILKHPKCTGALSHPLPKRVLDLSADTPSGLRVLETEREPAEYACLSHCWGKGEFRRLTQATLPIYTQCINDEVLPRTLRDAVTHCRSLKIRYLWIDSLCIVQDDMQDWARESARMSEYYGNCYVCLAATTSQNSDGGCDIDEIFNVPAKGTGQDGLPFDIHLGSLVRNPHFYEIPSASYKEGFPLLTRAWVYQERWLSPRVIHFCGSEVVFECRQMTTCECGQAIDSDSNDHKGKVRSWIKTMPAESLDMTMLTASKWVKNARPESLAQSPEGSSDRWHDLIETYSRLALTYQQDKLPAFSGLASAQLLTRDGSLDCQYLAGVRGDHLVEDLLWFVGGSARSYGSDDHLLFAQAARSRHYIAPTWSWASVMDPVRFVYPGAVSEALCCITATHVSPSSASPFGKVRSGHLKISGKLFPTSWGFEGTDMEPKAYHLWDWEKLAGNDLHAGRLFYPDFKLTKLGGAHSIEKDTLLYVLPMVRFSLCSNVAGFVLREVCGSSAHTTLKVFERVGWLWRWTSSQSEPGSRFPTFPYAVDDVEFELI